MIFKRKTMSKYKNLNIIFKHNRPYGIRDQGGFLLFFPEISKFTDQEQRYETEIKEQFDLAHEILNALNQHPMICPECQEVICDSDCPNPRENEC